VCFFSGGALSNFSLFECCKWINEYLKCTTSASGRIWVWMLNNSVNVLALYFGAYASHFDHCEVPLQCFWHDSVTVIFAFVIIIIIIIIFCACILWRSAYVAGAWETSETACDAAYTSANGLHAGQQTQGNFMSLRQASVSFQLTSCFIVYTTGSW